MKRQANCWMLAVAMISFWPAGTKAQYSVPPTDRYNSTADRYNDSPTKTIGPNPAGGTVSGIGGATLRPKVELLRMQVQLAARGNTLDEALDRLKTRREAALEKLSQLGADKDSTEVGRIYTSTWIGTVATPSPYTPVPVSPATISPANAGPGTQSPGGGWRLPFIPSSSKRDKAPVAPAPSMTPFETKPADAPAEKNPTETPTEKTPAQSPAEIKPVNAEKPTAVAPRIVSPPTPAQANASPFPPSAPPSLAPAAATSYAPCTPSSPGYVVPGGTPDSGYGTPVATPSSGYAAPVVSGYSGYASSAPSVSYPVYSTPPMTYDNKTYYTVTVSVTADWKLSGETQEAMLKEAEKLKKKIEAADVSGLKTNNKLPPEEESLRLGLTSHNAPALGPCTTSYGPVYAQPVEPCSSGINVCPPPPVYPSAICQPIYGAAATDCTARFVYVARVTHQQRKAALAEAFAKAKASAVELAEASGGSLGPIQTVSSNDVQQARPPIFYTADQGPPIVQGWSSLAEGKGHEDEIQSDSDAELCVLIQVTAVFRLQ